VSGAGFVNAHTHIYSGLASFGMPPPRHEPSTFLEILERVWWRLDRAIDSRTLRAAARVYVAEAVRHGTTVLVDHHESPSFIEGSLDVIADACEELGMRAVVCYGATERNGGREEAARGLAECRRFVRSNRRPLVRGVVGLHASFTVSDDTIREAGDLCRELNTVVHVHVAEDGADVEDAIGRGYRGPLERLHALGALPAGSILAHGVHLDAAQVQQADALGWWIVQNPRSNRHNKVGYPRALAESARVALGTDGFVSDMREEMSVLREEALAHGEDAGVVERRAAGGQTLVAEICGFSTDRPAAPAISNEVMNEIRADAREAAAILWKRMADL
jgi:cytosine/adenosine deaminase-related metal-dependent hydrolase